MIIVLLAAMHTASLFLAFIIGVKWKYRRASRARVILRRLAACDSLDDLQRLSACDKLDDLQEVGSK